MTGIVKKDDLIQRLSAPKKYVNRSVYIIAIAVIILVFLGVAQSDELDELEVYLSLNGAFGGRYSTLSDLYRTGLNACAGLKVPYWFEKKYTAIYVSSYYSYFPFNNNPDKYMFIIDDSHDVQITGDPAHIFAFVADLYVFPWYEKTRPFFPFFNIGIGYLMRSDAKIRSPDFDFMNARTDYSGAVAWTIGMGTDLKISRKIKLRLLLNSVGSETEPGSTSFSVFGAGVVYNLK